MDSEVAADGGSRRRWRVALAGGLIVAALAAGTMWHRTQAPTYWRCVGPAMERDGPIASTPEEAVEADWSGLDPFGSLPGSIHEYQRRDIDGKVQFWRRRGRVASLIWVSPVGSGWRTSGWALSCSGAAESDPGSFRR